MSEHDNPWTKALAENGSYDLEKAKRTSEAAVSQYQRGLKKTERILWCYLIACVAVAVLAMNSFLCAIDHKTLIGCGIVFLVAIETTILIKLWYWIMNTRLTLQKDMRQWQAHGNLPETAEHAPSWWLAEMSFGRPGLSRWERRAWFAGLVVVAVATSSYATYSQITSPSLLTLVDSVRLASDGTSFSTMQVAYQPKERPRLESFPFYTGCLTGKIRWLDERGRLLPYDISTVGANRCYTVHLIEPIAMGEWLRYTQIRETSAAASREGNIWTYQNDLTYGCSTNRFFITVELPRGAKVLSADPQPMDQTTENGISTLVFSASRETNERFAYKIQYELPGKTSAEKPAP